MRIGVLEWASSGGGSIGAWRNRSSSRPDFGLPKSIVEEGWLMTQAAIESLTLAGHQVAACLLPELVPRVQPQLGSDSIVAIDESRPIKRQWQSLYSTCDATIVIAPESDGVLEELIKWCGRRSIRTCNSSPEFIRQSTDKWKCAVHWRACGLPHPATRRLDHLSPQWLELAADHARASSTSEPLFVVKPRDGVGCEGIRRLTQRDLHHMADRLCMHGTASRWLVQPWLEGIACSRAAIVDRAGVRHWLPMARQKLVIGERVEYRGSIIEPDAWRAGPQHEENLDAAIESLGPGALGWVGVDFVYHPASDSITLVEVNPRLTTSFVELKRVIDPLLAGAIVEACK